MNFLKWSSCLLVLSMLELGQGFKTMLSKEKTKLAAWQSTLKQPKLDPIDEEYTKKLGSKKISRRRTDKTQGDSIKERMCSSYDMDALPAFFLKLGVMSSLIEDVAVVDRTIKALALSRTNDKWLRMKMADNDKSSLKPSKMEASAQAGKVPLCHGVDYLSALDALSAPSALSRSSVDVDTLVGSLADMADKQVSMLLANIFTLCDTASKEGCPLESGRSAVCPADNCISNSDCAFGEHCCPTHCGSYVCTMADKRRKGGSKNEDQLAAKCSDADAFLQCVYNNVGAKLCG